MAFKELVVQEGETRINALNALFINDVNVTNLFFDSLTTNPSMKTLHLADEGRLLLRSVLPI